MSQNLPPEPPKDAIAAATPASSSKTSAAHPHAAHQAHPHYSAPKFPPAEFVETTGDGTKVKRRVPRMRACDEKDEKGEICSGHLKRWFGGSPDIRARHGDELYVCERCRTIYLPNLQERPRTGTLAW